MLKKIVLFSAMLLSVCCINPLVYLKPEYKKKGVNTDKTIELAWGPVVGAGWVNIGLYSGEAKTLNLIARDYPAEKRQISFKINSSFFVLPHKDYRFVVWTEGDFPKDLTKEGLGVSDSFMVTNDMLYSILGMGNDCDIPCERDACESPCKKPAMERGCAKPCATQKEMSAIEICNPGMPGQTVVRSYESIKVVWKYNSYYPYDKINVVLMRMEACAPKYVALVQNVPRSTTSVEWKPEGLAPGKYFVYVGVSGKPYETITGPGQCSLDGVSGQEFELRT